MSRDKSCSISVAVPDDVSHVARRDYPSDFELYERNFYRCCRDFVKEVWLSKRKHNYSDRRITSLRQCLILINLVREKLTGIYVGEYLKEIGNGTEEPIAEWLDGKGMDPALQKYQEKIAKLTEAVLSVKSAASKIDTLRLYSDQI